VTRKRKPDGARHGSALDAPSEFGFVTSDTPEPGPVEARPHAPVSSPSPRPLLTVLWLTLKLSVGVAVVLSISVAIAWGAHRYAVSTPRFGIKEIDVAGNRHHSADRLARLAGIEKGQNLFALDTDVAEQKLLESPWVRRAKVGRKLPGTLRIEVEERVAACVALLDGSLYLVTPEGEPFKVVEPKDPSNLPVLTGVTGRDLAVDRARAVERLASGLEILQEYQAIPMSRAFPAEEVHLRADGTVVMTVGQRGMTLRLGRGPYRQKLLMAARIVGKLQPGGQLPGILFLDNEAHPERVVVRMR